MQMDYLVHTKCSLFINRITKKKRLGKKISKEYIILKTLSIHNKDRALKASRENTHVTYEGKLIRMTDDFSMETLKPRAKHSKS